MTLRWMCCSLLVFGQLLSAQSQEEKTPQTQPPSHLMGYSLQSSPAQIDSEKKFRDGIVPGNIRENMRRLSARPHHVGRPTTRTMPNGSCRKFKEWGLDAQIETFDVLFPTPKERVVELVAPTQFAAKLQEPVVAVRSDVESDCRTAAHLQRLFDRRRRNRSAGVRELRHTAKTTKNWIAWAFR